jgi:hypothetical protein
MSSTSPFATPQHHAALKSETQTGSDSIQDMIESLSLPDELKDALCQTVSSIDMFVVFDKDDCKKLVEDIFNNHKNIPYLRDKNHRHFLSAQLHMCVQFRAHGGSF